MADSLFGDLGLDEQTPNVLDFLGQEVPLAFRAEPALPTGGPVAGGAAPATIGGEGTVPAGEAGGGPAGGGGAGGGGGGGPAAPPGPRGGGGAGRGRAGGAAPRRGDCCGEPARGATRRSSRFSRGWRRRAIRPSASYSPRSSRTASRRITIRTRPP